MGMNGHGSLEHACPVCDVEGENKIPDLNTKPGKVWYPPPEKSGSKREHKLRPKSGQDYFKGTIYEKNNENQPKCLFRHNSKAFVDPETRGGVKDAATHYFFKIFKDYLTDVPNQICIDSMHTVESGVGKRMLSHSILGIDPSSKKSVSNLKFINITAANKIHKRLTEGKENIHVWQRGKLVSRIPRDLTNISLWKASEIRIFTVYIMDIILAELAIIDKDKGKGFFLQKASDKPAPKKRAMEEIRNYNHSDDGMDKVRSDYWHSYIIGHSILDSPKLIQNDEYIDIAKSLWQMTAKAGYKLSGINFAQITVHNLKHLPDQVRHHRETLTSMGCWGFESFYRILDELIHHGLHPLVQFKKRWLEQLDIEGQELKEMPDIKVLHWSSVGKWTEKSNEGFGEVWHMYKEGRNPQGEDVVVVRKYKNAKPILPKRIVMDKIVNVGTLLGKWKVNLNEYKTDYMHRQAFFDQVNDKTKFTEALFFKYATRGYSQPIHHLRTGELMSDEGNEE